MNVRIKPFIASGIIDAPPSKSFAHRYIISAFLSGRRCVIENVGSCDDVNATISALTSLGAKFVSSNGSLVFLGRETVKKATVYCNESGSTLRFLIPVCAALGINATFTGEDRLMQRPIDDFCTAINEHGAKLIGHSVSGKLLSGKYYLDAGLSSQFVTGMLFALSVLEGESELVIKGKRVSKGYIDITVSVLREFGVKILETENGYIIKGGFDAPKKVTVEGDWSGAAFPLCIGAIAGSVTVNNLKYPTLQADGAIIDILKKFGAKVEISDNSVTVDKAELVGIDGISCDDYPDIAQVISSVSAFANGKTTINNLSRLKIKESDRIDAIIKMLKVCGIKTELKNDSITVYGGRPTGGIFDGGLDHRTVMSSAVIACGCKGQSEIIGAEHINKSYPNFFEDLKKIGGNVDVGF